MGLNDSMDFNVKLSSYNGPLDTLLDLAKSQKVDLEKISITKLADQFHEFIIKNRLTLRRYRGWGWWVVSPKVVHICFWSLNNRILGLTLGGQLLKFTCGKFEII